MIDIFRIYFVKNEENIFTQNGKLIKNYNNLVPRFNETKVNLMKLLHSKT